MSAGLVTAVVLVVGFGALVVTLGVVTAVLAIAVDPWQAPQCRRLPRR